MRCAPIPGIRWTRIATAYAACAFSVIVGGATIVVIQWLSHCSTVHVWPAVRTLPWSRSRSSLRTFAVTSLLVFPRTWRLSGRPLSLTPTAT